MAADPVAFEFFVEDLQKPSNSVCCDTGVAAPQWASVSHGIYISIGASGIHRSLGVKVSFVQSLSMDSWRPVHLRMMQLGGNERFNQFMIEQGVPLDMPIREKYSTRAAEWYREALRAEAEGRELPPPLEPGVGHLPSEENLQNLEERRLLDQVFAKAPKQGSMTSGGVLEGKKRTEASATKTSWISLNLQAFWSSSENISADLSDSPTKAPEAKRQHVDPSEDVRRRCSLEYVGRTAAAHLAAAHLGAIAVLGI